MQFYLTAYAEDGNLLLNEMFESGEEKKAVQYGRQRLEEENCSRCTHRLTKNGELLLFHR
ncbi:YhzD family protein [Salibacterium aidingense]|uniref:YhzD family protein n=1 Tax=Salibacterium aidingense TaxID=384933 RepID=UPI000418014D|nr:YhzD family protein [Salibacterium aidingense]